VLSVLDDGNEVNGVNGVDNGITLSTDRFGVRQWPLC